MLPCGAVVDEQRGDLSGRELRDGRDVLANGLDAVAIEFDNDLFGLELRLLGRASRIDPVDALLALRFDAGLSANTGDCPTMGTVVEVAGASPHARGDIDCSGDVGPVDGLKLLRFDSGLSVAQEPDCPVIGGGVVVAAAAVAARQGWARWRVRLR